MKKILLLIISLFIGIFITMNIVNGLDEKDTLILNYYRYDGEYTGFNAWIWENAPNNGEGKKFDFNNSNVTDEYGAFLEIDLEKEFPNATRLGIIIKKGEWDGYREPGGDRFIEISQMEKTGNKLNAYTVEQDLNIGLSQKDLDNNKPNYNPRITGALFVDETTIKATATHKFVKYTLLENTKVIQTGTNDSKDITLNLESMSLGNKYTLEVEFTDGTSSDKVVTMSNLYETDAFTEAFTYDGDLGVIYTKTSTTFRLWAPISESVSLNLYNQGHPYYNNVGQKNEELTPKQIITMETIGNGVWEAVVEGNLANTYYTYAVNNYGITNEVTDPYSYSTGANGLRSLVVDFEATNPENWKKNDRPNNVTNLTDYIVYELHVRDLTTHETWNGSEENRGKFLGFTESGTTYTNDKGVTVSTGLDHLTELGVNAIQLLPIFDFGYIDEVALANDPTYQNTFNWGYMPYHFNTLEGAYATNPFDGNVRVNEFKQLVNSLHQNDMRVIMDVVYNHTGESEGSNFNKIIPGYYHRLNAEGGFSNGSGTGNETASERPMVRKFFVDSVKFLATEYNLSGFRFDLMALHDVETMLEIEKELHKIDPTIVIYGEPWDAGGAAIDPSIAAGKDNIKNLNTVGAFNDNTRDAIKGSVFIEGEGSWVQGVKPDDHVENIKYGIVGGTNHNQVSMSKWHLSPNRTINYVSAHDNNTLHDKLRLTGVKNDGSVEAAQIQANAIILTSQGIPFLHAGVDFMRSKPDASGSGYDENSYEAPDSVNQLRWDRKAEYTNVFEYYQTLIAIRKTFPQFRLNSSEDINNYIRFEDTKDANVIMFTIDVPNMPMIKVIHVGNKLQGHVVDLPEGKEFRQLTTIQNSNIFGLDNVSYKMKVFKNTTAILVENIAPENVSIKKKSIKINQGESFNPLSNINYDAQNDKVYVSSFYDVNVSSKYDINVTVVDKNGNLIKLNYLLEVTGGSGVKLK